jgi:hypothetical protein
VLLLLLVSVCAECDWRCGVQSRPQPKSDHLRKELFKKEQADRKRKRDAAKESAETASTMTSEVSWVPAAEAPRAAPPPAEGTLDFDADGRLKVFWIDMYEDQQAPGKLFIFGKVAVGADKWASAIVQVRNCEHIMHVLPRCGRGTWHVVCGEVV